MKVLHLICTDVFSGAENVACQIINGFQNDKNFQMVYCSPSGPNETSLAERKVKHLKLNKFDYKSTKKAIEEFEPDIIHAHDIKASVMASLICGKKIKIISHIHGNHENMRKVNIKTLMFNYCSKNFSKVIWVSQSAFDNYIFKDKVKEKSIILYNVINKKEIIDSIENDDSECELFDIIYLGRLTYAKNPERLIKIIKNIKAKGCNIKVALVGTGELYENIKELIEDFGLNENVRLFGYVTNPYKILNNSKMLVMTSRYEGTPMVALEAMALGKPIICTPTDGLKDIVKQNENGYLSSNDSELEDAIISLLKDDKKLKEYSKNALQQFDEVSNINEYINKIRCIYNNK